MADKDISESLRARIAGFAAYSSWRDLVELRRIAPPSCARDGCKAHFACVLREAIEHELALLRAGAGTGGSRG